MYDFNVWLSMYFPVSPWSGRKVDTQSDIKIIHKSWTRKRWRLRKRWSSWPPATSFIWVTNCVSVLCGAGIHLNTELCLSTHAIHLSHELCLSIVWRWNTFEYRIVSQYTRHSFESRTVSQYCAPLKFIWVPNCVSVHTPFLWVPGLSTS